ncbi:MAG: 6-chlorohydroxyquinol-1,2-dioxygenase, partial [Anaerolineae bacterium]|nr:6-chlorohydroxyquinol-1,2-dioxygenase [Anaerolineae bacterium]
TTGADGTFWFRTIKPSSDPVPTDGPVGELLRAAGRHPMRPAHIHFMIDAPGYERLITHVFVEGDQYLESDAVFGVKDSLVVAFTTSHDAPAAAELGFKVPFCEVEYNFGLKPVE